MEMFPNTLYSAIGCDTFSSFFHICSIYLKGMLSAAFSLIQASVARTNIMQNVMHMSHKTLFVKTISSSSVVKMFVYLSSVDSFKVTVSGIMYDFHWKNLAVTAGYFKWLPFTMTKDRKITISAAKIKMDNMLKCKKTVTFFFIFWRSNVPLSFCLFIFNAIALLQQIFKINLCTRVTHTIIVKFKFAHTTLPLPSGA